MTRYLSAVILGFAICTHQAEALFDAAICNAAEASTATASTCDDWLAINLELSNGDCCSGTTSTDLTQCNSLCTTVITGMVDNCFTEQQFDNFKVKSEACQILTIEKAMAKEGIACTDWKPILQGEARSFCIPELGKYLSSDTECLDTCINMIDTVPDFCIGQAIGYWQDVPIRDFHENCTAKVVDRVTNKADKTCNQWKALLELSINSRIGCGQYCQCTEECKELIAGVEANCPGYIVTNEWKTIGCAPGVLESTQCTDDSGAAFGVYSTFPMITMILGSFLAILGFAEW